MLLMTVTSDSAREVIGQLPDPETGRPIGQTGQLLDVHVEGNQVTAAIGLTSWAAPIADSYLAEMTQRLRRDWPDGNVVLQAASFDRPIPRNGSLALRIRSIVLVGSGKGGVGKSTIAASLACGLEKLGARVGLMDADVYGPSIPHLIGLEGRPEITEEKKIIPIRNGSMPVMSMGFLVGRDQAVIWRGPMLHGSITQFLRDVDWGELDYLVIDMPPGTGDIALTLSQLVPIDGAVVVCTPQEVALLDAVKAIAMFKRVNIPVLGMVENMSGFVSPDTGKKFDIFGSGGARDAARDAGVPVLGEVPIVISIRERGDEGRLAATLDDRSSREPLIEIAKNVVRELVKRHQGKPVVPQLPTL
jgi:ATP-binding protein involved in chromosome partitioning